MEDKIWKIYVDSLEKLIDHSILLKKEFSTKDLDNLGAKKNPKYFINKILKISKNIPGEISKTSDFYRAKEIYYLTNIHEKTVTLKELEFIAQSGRKDKNIKDNEIIDVIYRPFNES